MRKKLILLDLVLVALVAVTAMRVRDRWLEARKREGVVLRVPVKPAPAPPFSAIAKTEPVSPAQYVEIAQKYLFSPDRNPTVVIEVAPPKPMPPLPLLRGIMDFGRGRTAILSAKKGAPSQGYRAGDTIGEFTLVSVEADELVFEWDGKKVAKKVEELLDRSKPAPDEQPVAAAAPAPAPAPAPPPTTPRDFGPGIDLGDSKKSCQADDPAPDGSVKDGFRKVLRVTPFGKTCYWEPVR